eukprot:scpid73182/ scgid1863/ Regulator of G-protein signaling 12
MQASPRQTRQRSSGGRGDSLRTGPRHHHLDFRQHGVLGSASSARGDFAFLAMRKRETPVSMRSSKAGEKDKVARCNSAGSIYSLRSFLEPGMFDEGSRSTFESHIETEDTATPKPEVVSGWALSLKNLLTDPNGLPMFLKYCTQLLCEENLLFWQAVEDFRNAGYAEEEVQYVGKNIFNDFIHHTGKHQVNLNSKTSKAVKARVKEQDITLDMYDACQTEIFELMKTDSYRKFLQSDAYKDVLCLELDGKTLPWEEVDEPSAHSRRKGFLSFLRKDKRKFGSGLAASDDKKSFDTASNTDSQLTTLGRMDKKFHIRTKSSASQLLRQEPPQDSTK